METLVEIGRGGAGLLAMAAPVSLGAWWASRRGLRLGAGVPGLLAAATLAWAWITVGIELLGSLGLLAIGPLTAWSVLGLALGWISSFARRNQAPGDDPAPDNGIKTGDGLGISGWIAVFLVLLVWIVLGGRSLFGAVKVVSDGPIYHLYFAVRWWKAARLELIPIPFGESAATYFPAVGDIWLTWLMTAWGGDRLAKVGQVPFLFLSTAAAWDLARQVGASRSASAVAVGWFVTSTPLLVFTFEPNVDTIFLAGVLMAASFVARWILTDPSRRTRGPLALAGLAAGLAWATKPTGLVFVLPMLGLAAIAVLSLQPGPAARRLASAACLLIPALVGPSFWMARNFWLTGNPLYPLDLPALGWIGWYGPDAMTRSPYHIPRRDLRALADTVLGVLDPRLTPVWILAVVGLGRRSGNPTARNRVALALGLLAVLNVALYWVLIPYRTQQRFFLQALGMAAAPLALLLDRWPPFRCVAVALLAFHVLTPQKYPVIQPGEPPWDFTPLVINNVSGPMGPLFDPVVGVAALASALAVVLLAMAWGGGRAGRPSSRGIRLGFTAAAGAILLLGAWIATAVFGATWIGSDGFFPFFPDFHQGWIELDRRSGPRGTRVAYAGTNIPFYLMGRGFRNDVRYVNIDAHRDWLMHDYHRRAIAEGRPHWDAYPRPGWDRERPDPDAWVANLKALGIRLLVVTRVNVGEGPHNVADREGFPIERVWADARPDTFEPLHGETPYDPWFRIYRVRDDLRETSTDRPGRLH